MPTLLLTTLVLCLAGSVLPYEDVELVQSCMQHLDEGLKQGNPQYNWDRLNQLEQALARSKPGKEGCHFQTNLVEAHVYSVTADSFKGLNLSSSVVSTPVLPGSPCSMHTASALPSLLPAWDPRRGGMPGWLSVTYAGVDEEQVGFGHLLSMLYTSPTPGDVAPGKPAADPQRRHWGASAARLRRAGIFTQPPAPWGLKIPFSKNKKPRAVALLSKEGDAKDGGQHRGRFRSAEQRGPEAAPQHFLQPRRRDCPGSAAKNKGRSMAKPKHAIRFPVELMQGIRAREEHKLICIYIHSPYIFLDEQNSSVLNNHILGAFLQNRTVTGLRRPVEIQFWHNMVLDASNATCVFWVPGAGKAGSWSREGCKTQHREGTVVCLCSHLTYFAVLMIQAQNLSQPVLESLTYISTVGCSISAAATFCTLLLCCFFRRWPKDTTTRIHMNLLAALFLLNVSFLLSKPLATSTEGLCQAAAALLHGSLLCSLAWMGAEAFHLYLLLVKVYNIYIQHYLLKLCLFAWGLPTLVVMAVLIFSGETYGRHVISTTDGYQNMNMCWLTSPLAHFVTLCYSGLILLFNTLMLAAVVVMLRRIKRQKGQARRDWATVLGLTCLLGTTWGLAFFSFGVLLVPQLYLFTILNSLQGLFICLWYITTYRRSRSSSDSSTSR
ncbi:adhesion G-protein coupled receptor G5 [Mergus octosetaceus]